MHPDLLYPKLLDSSAVSRLKITETNKSYHILTERHLQAMWLEQKYFRQLSLKDGSKIEVLSPGIWNSEAGPDFLKAHIKIGDQELFGDIELHLSQESWIHHHHHLDPRYDDVILHVCYWEPVNGKEILTSKNTPIASTFLQPKLTIPETRLVKLIDLDLYPYKLFSGVGRCSRLLFSKLSKEKTIEFFQSAALWRLKEKWQRLVEKVENPTKCLIGGIAMSLGYKHNSEAFLSLYNELEKLHGLSENDVLALALGCCGFFDPHFQNKWNDSPLYNLLNKEFSHKTHILPTQRLKLDHIRPANHPVRRLALLVRIITDPEIDTLGNKIASTWDSSWNNSHPKKWRTLKQHLLEAIPNYEDPYWLRHYTFETKEQSRPVRLIGEDLKQEILINVFLPFLFVSIEKKGSFEELQAFKHFYASLPAGNTKKGTYLAYRFFGDSQKKECLSHADSQQGAYQVHRDFCIHFEASCQGCPFVEMYQATFK